MDTNSGKPQPVALKYHRELSAIDGCPGSVHPCDCVGYRSVHEELGHPRNFEPTALIDPGRLGRSSSAETRCSLWGLSMYDTLDRLRNMVSRVEKTNTKFRDLVGHYYVVLQLAPGDGRRTNAKKGHFDLHPSTTFNPLSRVKKHEQLTP